MNVKITNELRLALIFAATVLPMNSALAYIGPGLGAGTIGVILGILGSVFLALFAIFWYPIKRALFKDKGGEDEECEEYEEERSNKQKDGVHPTSNK